MARYHPYSRRVWRFRLVAWAGRNRRLITAATAIVMALIVAETVLVTVILTPTPFTWWLLGAFQATLVAVYLHVLHSAFLATDREAIWHRRGA